MSEKNLSQQYTDRLFAISLTVTFISIIVVGIITIATSF